MASFITVMENVLPPVDKSEGIKQN